MDILPPIRYRARE